MGNRKCTLGNKTGICSSRSSRWRAWVRRVRRLARSSCGVCSRTCIKEGDRSDVEAFDAPSDSWIRHVVGSVERFGERGVRAEAFEVGEETWGVERDRCLSGTIRGLIEKLDVDSVDVGGCAGS